MGYDFLVKRGLEMIKDYLNNRTVQLKVEASDRIDAIRKAASSLVRENKISEKYVDNMIAALDEYGPYIVLIPGIALAHAEPCSEVYEESMSMMTLKNPVKFGHETNDPVHTVFVLASNEKFKHMEVLMSISKLLMKEEFIELLQTCEDVDELLTYIERKES